MKRRYRDAGLDGDPVPIVSDAPVDSTTPTVSDAADLAAPLLNSTLTQATSVPLQTSDSSTSTPPAQEPSLTSQSPSTHTIGEALACMSSLDANTIRALRLLPKHIADERLSRTAEVHLAFCPQLCDLIVHVRGDIECYVLCNRLLASLMCVRIPKQWELVKDVTPFRVVLDVSHPDPNMPPDVDARSVVRVIRSGHYMACKDWLSRAPDMSAFRGCPDPPEIKFSHDPKDFVDYLSAYELLGVQINFRVPHFPDRFRSLLSEDLARGMGVINRFPELADEQWVKDHLMCTSGTLFAIYASAEVLLHFKSSLRFLCLLATHYVALDPDCIRANPNKSRLRPTDLAEQRRVIADAPIDAIGEHDPLLYFHYPYPGGHRYGPDDVDRWCGKGDSEETGEGKSEFEKDSCASEKAQEKDSRASEKAADSAKSRCCLGLPAEADTRWEEMPSRTHTKREVQDALVKELGGFRRAISRAIDSIMEDECATATWHRLIHICMFSGVLGEVMMPELRKVAPDSLMPTSRGVEDVLTEGATGMQYLVTDAGTILCVHSRGPSGIVTIRLRLLCGLGLKVAVGLRGEAGRGFTHRFIVTESEWTEAVEFDFDHSAVPPFHISISLVRDPV